MHTSGNGKKRKQAEFYNILLLFSRYIIIFA